MSHDKQDFSVLIASRLGRIPDPVLVDRLFKLQEDFHRAKNGLIGLFAANELPRDEIQSIAEGVLEKFALQAQELLGRDDFEKMYGENAMLYIGTAVKAAMSKMDNPPPPQP